MDAHRTERESAQTVEAIGQRYVLVQPVYFHLAHSRHEGPQNFLLLHQHRLLEQGHEQGSFYPLLFRQGFEGLEHFAEFLRSLEELKLASDLLHLFFSLNDAVPKSQTAGHRNLLVFRP